jgi:hypothetical protein
VLCHIFFMQFMHSQQHISRTMDRRRWTNSIVYSFLSFKSVRLLWVHINITVCGTEVTDIQKLQKWIHSDFWEDTYSIWDFVTSKINQCSNTQCLTVKLNVDTSKSSGDCNSENIFQMSCIHTVLFFLLYSDVDSPYVDLAMCASCTVF